MLFPQRVSSRGGTKTGLERAVEIELTPPPHISKTGPLRKPKDPDNQGLDN